MLVDKVYGVLQSSTLDNGSQDEEEYQSDVDKEMSDYEEYYGDDDPNDLMTLSQFHDEVHRKALVQKGVHDVTPSHKKGRVEEGERSV